MKPYIEIIEGENRKVPKDKNKRPKMDKQVEEDLIAEVQHLHMENGHLNS